jgi:hypothetical protein
LVSFFFSGAAVGGVTGVLLGGSGTVTGALLGASGAGTGALFGISGAATGTASFTSFVLDFTLANGLISTKGRPKSLGSDHCLGWDSFSAIVQLRRYETNLKLGKAQP